jgi:hypothetical protein
MIAKEKLPQALKALQRLIIHSKAQAYQSGDTQVADLLNDMELLPEFLADEQDCTQDFVLMLQGIADVHPGCRYIMEEFEQTGVTQE